MSTPFFPGPTSSAIQETNKPAKYSSTVATVKGVSGRAIISQSLGPAFNSNVDEIVIMTQNAFLDANVEIGGSLTVDGVLNANVNVGSNLANLTVNPGPLTVTGSATVSGPLTASGGIAVTGAIQGGADTSPSDFKPDGVPSAGAVGLLADAGHVHPNFAYLSGLVAPTGAIAESVPRRVCGTTSGTINTSQVVLVGIPLMVGQIVNNLTFAVASTNARGITHGYYVLTDPNLIVQGVTADQTGGTTWTSVSTAYTLALTAPYTVPLSGLYYAGVSATGSTTPNFAASTSTVGGLSGLPPILAGTSTSQATPLTVGSTAASINSSGANNFYVYAS